MKSIKNLVLEELVTDILVAVLSDMECTKSKKWEYILPMRVKDAYEKMEEILKSVYFDNESRSVKMDLEMISVLTSELINILVESGVPGSFKVMVFNDDLEELEGPMEFEAKGILLEKMKEFEKELKLK